VGRQNEMPAYAGMTVARVMQKVDFTKFKRMEKNMFVLHLKECEFRFIIIEIRVSMKLYYKEFRGEPLMLL
jgi:transposase-like protein